MLKLAKNLINSKEYGTDRIVQLTDNVYNDWENKPKRIWYCWIGAYDGASNPYFYMPSDKFVDGVLPSNQDFYWDYENWYVPCEDYSVLKTCGNTLLGGATPTAETAQIKNAADQIVTATRHPEYDLVEILD